MIREINHPSIARCTLPMYIGFLLSEPNRAVGEIEVLICVGYYDSFGYVDADEKRSLNDRLLGLTSRLLETCVRLFLAGC